MDIDKIISDYLSGEISEDDGKKLDDWLAEDPSHRDQFESLMKIWKSPVGYQNIVNSDDEKEKIWKRLQGESNRTIVRDKKASFPLTLLKYAAAILVIVALDYFLLNKPDPEYKTPAVAEKIERKNPLGQKSRIQLPDGSTVWLNAGSKLSYSSFFTTSDTRRIHLEGEAYFEVVENKAMPFEVVTKGLMVTVLGTSFNVNAFEDKSVQKIALKTGKVKIECLDSSSSPCVASYLNPGELALFNNQTGNINISEFKDSDPFGWKDGKIVFQHASFNEVVEILSRWYNVEFKITGRLPQEWNYSATFEDEVLENILESLRFSENIEYKINGSIVEIKL